MKGASILHLIVIPWKTIEWDMGIVYHYMALVYIEELLLQVTLFRLKPVNLAPQLSSFIAYNCIVTLYSL